MTYRILFIFLIGCNQLYAFSEKHFKKTIENYCEKHEVPGMAVALYINGHGYLYSFGYADDQKKIPVSEHTIFEIGSITKSFTTTILAHEVLEGHMKLHDKVSVYLPFVKRHSSPLQKVTLKQLATHTSSLKRKSPVRKSRMTKDRVLRALLCWRPEFPLGTHYCYSNLGYNILGYCLEQETGKTYMQLFKSFILEPLKMNETMLHVPSKRCHYYAQGHNAEGIPIPRMRIPALGAAGALKSTSFDMMKFLKANLNVLGPKDLRAAMQFAQKPAFEISPYINQALSWQRIEEKNTLIIDKNGGVTGFSTWIGFIPGKKIGIVLLTNKRNKQLTGLGRRLLHEVNRKKLAF